MSSSDQTSAVRSGETAAPDRRIVGGRSIRWDQGRADAAYAQGLWVKETLADALARAAATEPNRVLVSEGDVRIDAATLLARATTLAHALLARIPVGSVISFMLPNWHEAAEIYLGATLAGMVANPILPSLRDHDLGFLLKDVDSRMIFIPETFRKHDYAAMLTRVAEASDNPPLVVVLRGEAGPHIAYASLFDGAEPRDLPTLDPDAVRMIMYTSGTTGSPKGVLHTHNSLHALLRQIGQHWHAAPGDTFLVPSPISHIGGSIYAFEGPLLLGTSVILMDQWYPDEGVKIMVDQKITHLAGATPFLEQLLAAAKAAGTTLPDLKVFICGGASVPPSIIREASAYLTHTAVTRVYGSTEVPVTTVGAPSRDDLDHAADTDGRIGIAEVKIAADGEICARGPQMLAGYMHAEHEASVFDEEGFYRTGDTGRLLDGGYVVVEGRKKDIIIRFGENIAPKEIEDILIEHPGVTEIAIVGLPHERTGEQACAVIVEGPEAAPTLKDILAFLDAKGVARFKIPERIEIWPSLPKNDAGKVLKHKIRADLIAADEAAKG
ncbi:AMP-binding protein [Sphingobium sufflavum]|uniref:AMP-binding protein n=1 Tax=Sphingobium sufflavum TaxID=1129547 RepID=UPI001F342893|nr:AMP-binding protein [Sphingobium sufflavum]MCE7795698.1 AMP-binding protein [Sphingobium sufflavum]